MPNEFDNVELIVGDLVCGLWDEVSIDADLETPADAWSLTLYNTEIGEHLAEIAADQRIEIRYHQQTVLTGVIDRMQVSAQRNGVRFNLSGRDLAAVLLDNSVQLAVQQQVPVKEAATRYFLQDPAADYFRGGIRLPKIFDVGLLNRQIAVEPGESIWSLLAKAAEVMGQYIWVDAEGTIFIDNPFVQPQPTPQRLALNRHAQSNVLTAEYAEDSSELFSEVIVLGHDQRDQATATTAKSDEQRRWTYQGEPLNANRNNRSGRSNAPDYTGTDRAARRIPRRKIVLDSLADTAVQAANRARKILQDGQLSAYSLTVDVAGWTIATGEVWATGWTVQFDSDFLPQRVSGDWVVMGRTLRLSRNNGKTTQLRLKRQQFWMQPVAPSPLSDRAGNNDDEGG